MLVQNGLTHFCLGAAFAGAGLVAAKDCSLKYTLQPKAAVEFDQAINYVNKIKVSPPLLESGLAYLRFCPYPLQSATAKS